MLDQILSITQMILAAALVAAVLLQARGTGLGVAFGGGDTVYRTKRGIEKILFRATIVTAILFFGVALANVLLS